MGIHITKDSSDEVIYYDSWSAADDSPHSLFYDRDDDLIMLGIARDEYVHFPPDDRRVEVLSSSGVKFPLVPAYNVEVTISN